MRQDQNNGKKTEFFYLFIISYRYRLGNKLGAMQHVFLVHLSPLLGCEAHLQFFLPVRPCLVRKNFQDFPSHRIFGHMHRALNMDENKN